MSPAHFDELLFRVMRNLTPKRFFALLLGLWVALAPAMFAVPATAMSVQTSMTDDAGSGGCDACPEDVAARGICLLMCLNAMLLAITTEPGRLVTDFDGIHRPGRHPAMLGCLSTPDPAPPKAVSLL
jgi:hypothetical protein